MTHVSFLTVKILPSLCVRVIGVVASNKNGVVFVKIVVSSVAVFVLVGVIGEVLGEVKLSVLAGDFKVFVVVVGIIVVEKVLQSPTLHVVVLDKSLDVTSLQYEKQDRTLVLSPLPHVLLQDDHWPHKAYSGEPENTLKNDQKSFS